MVCAIEGAAGSSWWDRLAAGWSLGLASVCLFRSTGIGRRLRIFRDLPNNPNHRVSRYSPQGLTGGLDAEVARIARETTGSVAAQRACNSGAKTTRSNSR